MIVFTIGNGSQTPIPLRSVYVYKATVNALVDNADKLFVPCSGGCPRTRMVSAVSGVNR